MNRLRVSIIWLSGTMAPIGAKAKLAAITLLLLGFHLCPAWGAPIVMDPLARTFPGPSRFVTTGLYDPLDIYMTANGFGLTFLDPVSPVHPLTRESLYFNFFNVLDRRFSPSSGWSFAGNARRFSDNSLRVHSYDAIGGSDPLRREGVAGPIIPVPIVGALFDVEYRPGASDPTDNIHWIQVVANNHKGGGVHGALDNKVDIGATQGNPFYDIGGTANNRNLLDRPARTDIENDHDWIAALFLVSGPTTPGRVTIYNDAAILWGWENRFFRVDNLLAFHDQAHMDVLDDLPSGDVILFHDEFHTDLERGATFFTGPFSDEEGDEPLSDVPEPPVYMLFLTGMSVLVAMRHVMSPGTLA